MPKLAVFGDEIAKEITTQIEVMQAAGVQALELRGAEGRGVLDLAGELRQTVRARLQEAGVEVFSIGSPLGKSEITAPFETELARLDQAIEQAHYFGAPRIRIFSFFIPERDWATWRGAVLDRLGQMAARAAAAEVLLCHENEARIYGERIANVRDLLQSVNSPALRAVHDPANWVHAGEVAFPDGYEAVAAHLEYLHIKDYADGRVLPAGQGAGRIPELLAHLQRSGWEGYLSLEPHLGGGPEQFQVAARALQGLLDSLGWAWS
ncbi:MAG: sugar phosphate isomerase/epimerase [Fimbriimonadaceae bacterium]|nr:sugar phosphate isomerase/epimerase [Fimbriimonadaceae bacterium]